MIPYSAPVEDMKFNLCDVIGLERLQALPGCEEVTEDLVDAILTEAGKLAENVLAPLNFSGDQQGCKLENGVVTTPDGFREAYQQFIAAGWNGLPHDTAHGGQNLPWSLSFPLQEMWNASNMSFALCPMLTQGAVEALHLYGTEEQKALYLDKLVSGEWTGTMNLTEPQAGSDLSQIKTRAVPQEDGSYRLTGTKIFITFGDHDWTRNIIHMVLARLPDAPEGTKGISMFLVPKYLVNADGSPGQANDLRCVSLEHKLGIHASPTAVMSFGDDEGAVGWLIGEENKGLVYMFSMMNNARLGVGIQGVGIADRAWQQARDYAAERVQSRPLEPVEGYEDEGAVPIIHHPDICRMLGVTRAKIEAARALYAEAGYWLDVSKRGSGEDQRRGQAFIDLLTPVVKAWSTELGVEASNMGVQIHGGMGYIEETGAAQHLRDARIATIYEGTNGIQSNDLVFRKILRDEGAAMRAYMAEMKATEKALAEDPNDAALSTLRTALSEGLNQLADATDWLLATGTKSPNLAAASAFPYLTLFGNVAGGALLARAALSARARRESGEGHADFLHQKQITAQIFATHILPESRTLTTRIINGAESLLTAGEGV